MKQNDEIRLLIEALKYFYPEYFGENPHPIESFFEYKGGKYPKDWILSETFRISKIPEKTSYIGTAIRELEIILGSTPVEAPERAATPNTLTPEQLKQFQKEAQAGKEQGEEIKEKTKQSVRDGIKRQQEIHAEQIQKAKIAEAALKDKKIYYKVADSGVKETQEVRNLKEQARANPKQFIEDSAGQFRQNPSLKNLSAQELDVVSKQAAVTCYDISTGNSPLLFARIVSDPKFLDSIPDPNTREYIRSISEYLTDQKLSQIELSKYLFDHSKIDGYRNASDIKIEFSDTPQPGYSEFSYSDQIVASHIENINLQSSLLDSIGDLGEGGIKSQILLGIGNHLDSYIAKLPVDSVLAKAYNSEFVKYGLSSMGFIKAAEFTATSGFGKVVIGSGFGPVANFLQGSLGINLGVEKVVGEAAKKAAEKGLEVVGKVVVEGGAELAGKGTVGAGLTAALIPAFAWAGPFAPILAGIASFLASSAIGKWVSNLFSKLKVWIKRNNLTEIFPALLGLAAAAPILGFGAGVQLGTGLFLGLKFLNSTPASRAAFGRGIGNFFKILFRATFMAMGIEIFASFFVFALLVVFILFIINSGAYVVPYWYGERSSSPPFGPNQMGGLVSSCKESAETGPEITEQLANRIRNGKVNLLPETVWGRRDGICITPTMIVMHWSAGANDDPDGNQRTYDTLVARGLSCQLGTDADDVWLMEKFFEKQVEFPACAGEWNTFSINNEMAGAYFTISPPPPNLEELEMTYNVTCEVMKQYKIPWSQIYGHYQVPNSGKIDPGKEFLERVFIPEIRRRCPNDS